MLNTVVHGLSKSSSMGPRQTNGTTCILHKRCCKPHRLLVCQNISKRPLQRRIETVSSEPSSCTTSRMLQHARARQTFEITNLRPGSMVTFVQIYQADGAGGGQIQFDLIYQAFCIHSAHLCPKYTVKAKPTPASKLMQICFRECQTKLSRYAVHPAFFSSKSPHGLPPSVALLTMARVRFMWPKSE